MIVCEIILASFKFGDFPQNRQFAKLKTSPKFPAIRYVTLHHPQSHIALIAIKARATLLRIKEVAGP